MLSTTLSGSCGFPLCISGLTHHLTLSKEMADHDRRRKVIKKRRSEEVSVEETWLQEMRESEDVRDLVALLQDLGSSWSCSSHTAKAA